MQKQELYERCFSAIQHMRLGKRILSACKLAGISRAQLIALADADENVREQLLAAEQESDDILAESLVDANEWADFGAHDPKMAATWAKNVQWFLARKRKEKYGDKLTIESKTTVDIQIINRLEKAKERVASLSPSVVDISPLEEYQPLEAQAVQQDDEQS